MELLGLGCKAYKQEGEAFMKDYFANSDNLFVLIKISSLTILHCKINIDDYTNLNSSN